MPFAMVTSKVIKHMVSVNQRAITCVVLASSVINRAALSHEYWPLALSGLLASNLDTIVHSQARHPIQDRILESQLFESIVDLPGLQSVAEDRLIGRPILDGFGTDPDGDASQLFERGVMLAPVAD
jgi:hypothetical protein